MRLDVHAPQECTSQADLTARILARLRRATFADDAAALGVRARFTALPSGNIVAELTLTKPGAKPSSRRLVARSCAQAADAAALIVAVTLDPTAISEEPAAIEEAPANGEVSAERQPRREPPPSGPPATALEPGEPAADSASPAQPRIGAQVAGQVLGGVAPQLMPSAAVYVIAGFDRETLWSPAVMLGATHGFGASVKATGGTANFWLDALSLDACALRIRFRALETRACASALLGRLSANGTDTANAAGVVRRPFASAGPAAMWVLQIDPIIELAARATVGVNLIRDSFEFAPLVFHTVPRLSFAASIGIGIRSR